MNEIFRLLLAQKQAKDQQESPDQVVRHVMIHRLSPSPSDGMALPSSQEPPIITDGWTREIRRRGSSIDNPHELLEKQFAGMQHHNHSSTIESHSMDRVDLPEQVSMSSLHESESDCLMSPLPHHNDVIVHDGNILQQELECTDGVVVSDRMNLLIPKERKRAAIHHLTVVPLLYRTPQQLLSVRVRDNHSNTLKVTFPY